MKIVTLPTRAREMMLRETPMMGALQHPAVLLGIGAMPACFAFGLGLGLPLFVLAVFPNSLDRLPRSGPWMVWVRTLMGWVLVGMAGSFVGPLLPQGWGVMFPAALLIATCLHLERLKGSAAVAGSLTTRDSTIPRSWLSPESSPWSRSI